MPGGNPYHDPRNGQFTTASGGGAVARTGKDAPEYGRGKQKRGAKQADPHQRAIDSAKAKLDKGVADLEDRVALRSAIQYIEAYRGSTNSKGEVDYVGSTTNIHGFGALNGRPYNMMLSIAESRGDVDRIFASGAGNYDAMLKYATEIATKKK